MNVSLVGTGLGIVAIVVWVVCAYGCYVRAPERRRRPGVWTVLGIFFGPFALFALFLLPKGEAPTRGRAARR